MHTSYRQRLIDELVNRQKRNPSYSLRGFARDLKVSPTALSDVLNAKRNFSRANLVKVADRLAFTPSQTRQALREIASASDASSDDTFTLLGDDVFCCMSNWYYFAILSLAEARPLPATPRWIAGKFGITALQAQEAVARLVRLGLVRVRKGRLHYDGRPLRTTSDIPSSAARNLQHDHLKLAAVSLERDPLHLRDMTSMTMVTSAERIKKAKERIRKFRRKLARFLEAEGGDEVYVFAAQLFPVTQGGGA